MLALFAEADARILAAVFGLLGVCVGGFLVRCIVRLAEDAPLNEPLRCPGCHRRYPVLQRFPLLGYCFTRGCCRHCGTALGLWVPAVELGTGLLFAALVTAVLGFDCQGVHSVRPSELGRISRLVYHLILFALLIAAVGTDFREYVIPDRITMTGVLIGLGGAALAGDFQLIHLWIDWNREHPIHGPYIPAWIAAHPHWHGLAWSVAGMLAGGGITWLVRILASLILGREALGFGDVTLMAMIGSFLGWQPMVFVFLLAPLGGLVLAGGTRLLTNRPFIPYGPCLAVAAIGVLFVWHWLWRPTRSIFGDWPSLAILGGVALAALVVLLGLLRLYRSIPVRRTAAGRVAAPVKEQETMPIGTSPPPVSEPGSPDVDREGESA